MLDSLEMWWLPHTTEVLGLQKIFPFHQFTQTAQGYNFCAWIIANSIQYLC